MTLTILDRRFSPVVPQTVAFESERELAFYVAACRVSVQGATVDYDKVGLRLTVYPSLEATPLRRDAAPLRLVQR